MKIFITRPIPEVGIKMLQAKGYEVLINEKAENNVVELDTKMTAELEAEGYAREISRKIQDCRKKAGLIKKDKEWGNVSKELRRGWKKWNKRYA